MLGPIFIREWLTLPRRGSHYVARGVFLGGMWVLALTAWQAIIGWDQTATLGDHARFGFLLFQILTFLQLILLLFFSALSAASSITQEKDRRTFILLLMTDLRNYEIVLGKLLGSLLQMLLLLMGMVPIFMLLLFLGGVMPHQVLEAFLVLGTTALAAGSLGCLVALWREKTFQTIALTALFLILYLFLVHALALAPLVLGESAWLTFENVVRLQAWLQPFLAMEQVLDPPLNDQIPSAYGFGLAMLTLSALLNGLSILRLRVWNPSGEPIIQREQVQGEVSSTVEGEEKIDRTKVHAAPGPVRKVWANPILWREVVTRAYGRRPLLVKFAYFVVVGLVGYFALGPAQAGQWAAAKGLVPVAILSLLLISAQAVTSITTERDLGALDLLLVTDLTPREFIFGKLWGILYNSKEYIVPPLILAGIYGFRGLLASAPHGYPELLMGRNIESLICVVLGMLILFAFTMVLGVHVGLGTPNSRLAIANTLGTVFFLSVGTMLCIYLILINGRSFENQWFSFVGFIALGIGGMLWILKGDRPSDALKYASVFCPLAVFYSVTNILVGRPGLDESADPLIPFLVTASVFSFTIFAMLMWLLSEFDVALGRTGAGGG